MDTWPEQSIEQVTDRLARYQQAFGNVTITCLAYIEWNSIEEPYLLKTIKIEELKIRGADCRLVFVSKKRKKERVRSQAHYWCLRRSRYSDAASAENATTAIPLNSGTGMLVCGRPRLLPEPGLAVWPPVTLIVPSGVVLYPGPDMVMLYVPGTT